MGVSHRNGNKICYWVLTKPGTVVVETTVQHVIRDDLLDANTTSQVEIFNTYINERIDETKIRIQ